MLSAKQNLNHLVFKPSANFVSLLCVSHPSYCVCSYSKWMWLNSHICKKGFFLRFGHLQFKLMLKNTQAEKITNQKGSAGAHLALMERPLYGSRGKIKIN